MAIVPARAVICRLLLRELALNCTTPDGKQGCSIDSFKQVDQATFCAFFFAFFFKKWWISTKFVLKYLLSIFFFMRQPCRNRCAGQSGTDSVITVACRPFCNRLFCNHRLRQVKVTRMYDVIIVINYC